MQQLKIALHSYCLSLRDESLILAQIRVHEYSRTPHFSTLNPRLSILDFRFSCLETRPSRPSRCENRVETVNLPLSGTVYNGITLNSASLNCTNISIDPIRHPSSIKLITCNYSE